MSSTRPSLKLLQGASSLRALGGLQLLVHGCILYDCLIYRPDYVLGDAPWCCWDFRLLGHREFRGEYPCPRNIISYKLCVGFKEPRKLISSD